MLEEARKALGLRANQTKYKDILFEIFDCSPKLFKRHLSSPGEIVTWALDREERGNRTLCQGHWRKGSRMLTLTPDELKNEEKRIAGLWLQDPKRPDMGEFIERHGSEEYRAYCRKVDAHIDEMERQGIMVG